MPFLEQKILKVLRATGGADGGLTASELAEVVFTPLGRVRMTLRRLLDRGEVRVTRGLGADARYLPTELHDTRWRHPRSTDDFGWGQGRGHGPSPGAGSGGTERGAGSADRGTAAELERLRDEVARLQRDNVHLRAALTRRTQSDPASAGLDARLDSLIGLCHPDRHDNSERANEVTRWLLELRKQRRG